MILWNSKYLGRKNFPYPGSDDNRWTDPRNLLQPSLILFPSNSFILCVLHTLPLTDLTRSGTLRATISTSFICELR
jgi:hypothetical protein